MANQKRCSPSPEVISSVSSVRLGKRAGGKPARASAPGLLQLDHAGDPIEHRVAQLVTPEL